jgi:hypothetical protein
MKSILYLATALGCLFALPALAGVYKCVGADGRIVYTNDPNAARRCKALDESLPVSTVPAPTLQLNKPTTANPGPTDFPRVTPDAQRNRDSARRQILENELQSEQTALEKVKTELQTATEDESLASGLANRLVLHERNIEAIRREIGLLR